MTVSSTDNRIEYSGNGVTTAFSFPYRFLANADLKVYVDDVLKTITTHYTVTGAGDDAGGTVTMLTAPATGTSNVVILRDPALTQALDLVENDPLPVEEVERSLDLLTMITQRLKDLQERSITLSDSDVSATLQIPDKTDRVSKLLGFDSMGDLIAVLSADDIETLNDNVDAIIAMFTDMSSLDFNSVNFDLTPTDTDAVGRLVWNDTDGTLNLGLKGGNVVLQVGQETVVRCLNKTGSTITNGSVVRITGAQGNRVTIVKAQADSSANAANTVGMATEDIANNAEGFVTALGAVRNLDTSAYAEGDTVYLSSSVAGGLTTTTPSVAVRIGVIERAHASLGRIFVHLGEAVANNVDNVTNGFRLTLTSGTPVTTTDVTGATTIYCTPYQGNSIALYSGSAWVTRSSAEFSLALGTLTSGRPYDVFCYDNAGTPTLEFLVWTSDTARATNLTYQDGVLVKSGDATRRYLGSFRTVSTTATEDSIGNRYLFNYYNRVIRPCRQTTLETTASWTYTTATWRQANANANNQFNVLIGWADTPINVHVKATGQSGVTSAVGSGIGIDSTTLNSATTWGALVSSAGSTVDASSFYRGYPTVGKHTYVWLEFSTAVSTTTWAGQAANGGYQSGISGEFEA